MILVVRVFFTAASSSSSVALGLLVSPRFPITTIVVEVVGWEVQNLNRPLIYTDIDLIHSGLYNPEIVSELRYELRKYFEICVAKAKMYSD